MGVKKATPIKYSITSKDKTMKNIKTMNVHYHGWGNHTQLKEAMQEALQLTGDQFDALTFNKVLLMQYAKVLSDSSILINHVTEIERKQVDGKETEYQFYMHTPDGKVDLGSIKKSNIRPLKY